MYISSIGIADMTGIEDFINLVTLSCGQNTFTTLNLLNHPLLGNYDNTQIVTWKLYENQRKLNDIGIYNGGWRKKTGQWKFYNTEGELIKIKNYSAIN